jgi:hypothetical protein
VGVATHTPFTSVGRDVEFRVWSVWCVAGCPFTSYGSDVEFRVWGLGSVGGGHPPRSLPLGLDVEFSSRSEFGLWGWPPGRTPRPRPTGGASGSESFRVVPSLVCGWPPTPPRSRSTGGDFEFRVCGSPFTFDGSVALSFEFRVCGLWPPPRPTPFSLPTPDGSDVEFRVWSVGGGHPPRSRPTEVHWATGVLWF